MRLMIYITQLIFLKEGQADIFQEFEQIAIPIISKYKGELLLRIRPDASSIIEKTIEQPYEVHLIKFATNKDFEEFMKDEEREKWLHLKVQSIQSTLLIKGQKYIP